MEMEQNQQKLEKVSSNELQQFYDSLTNNLHTKCDYTIDYFDTSLGTLYSRDCPSSLNFSVAVLHEVLCNLKPCHELWDKVKFAAFLLNLATRGIDFGLLYDIYHTVEIEANLKSLSWREKEIKNAFEEKVVEKLEVKVDGSGLDEVEESKDHINQMPDPFYGYNYPDFGDGITLFEKQNKGTKRKGKSLTNNVRKKSKKKVSADENRIEDCIETKKETPDPEDEKDEHIGVGNFEDCNGVSDEESYNNLNSFKNGENIKPAKKIKKEKLKGKPGRKPRIDWETIPCTLCDFQAKNNHFLDKHTFEEHEASRLCTQCGYLCISFKDYVSHNQTHLWTCEICKKKVLGMKGFRWHMRKHKTGAEEDKTSIAKVPCDICGVFMLEKSLKHHHLNDHSEEIIKCDICDYTANSKYKVAVHRKRHFNKITNCPECGKVVKDLKSHFRRKCGNTKEKERHFCHLCEKSFSLKHGLDRHIKNIHQRICGFHCDMCEYKTYDNYNLKLHISKNHTKEDMEKICPYCQQKTGSLQHHIKIYHYQDQIQAKELADMENKKIEQTVIIKTHLPS